MNDPSTLKVVVRPTFEQSMMEMSFIFAKSAETPICVLKNLVVSSWTLKSHVFFRMPRYQTAIVPEKVKVCQDLVSPRNCISWRSYQILYKDDIFRLGFFLGKTEVLILITEWQRANFRWTVTQPRNLRIIITRHSKWECKIKFNAPLSQKP